jgi:hypothetical protein
MVLKETDTGLGMWLSGRALAWKAEDLDWIPSSALNK